MFENSESMTLDTRGGSVFLTHVLSFDQDSQLLILIV